MRGTFSNSLVHAASHDPNILLLTGDHGYALFDDFRRAVPSQFINVGVAEQNMVGMAAGLAKAGFKPVVYGLSAFVPIRVLEQIKLDVCYEQLPVVFIGDGAGVVYSSLGSSHQSTEDIAALRAIPHIDILSPADDEEMSYAMAHAMRFAGPVYLRMGKSDVGQIHERPIHAPVGNLVEVRHEEGRSPAIIATGSMVKTALTVSESGLRASVWSAPSITPFNRSQLEHIARSTDVLIVIEEHSTVGGLGGLVAEITAEMVDARPRVIRLGSESHFSEKCGSYSYLLNEHKIDAASLKDRLIQKGILFS